MDALSKVLRRNLLVHLMSDKLEVGYLCSVLDQSPHILSIRFINVIVHCFQIQTVHLQRAKNLQTDDKVNCLAEKRRGEETTVLKYSLDHLCWSQRFKISSMRKSLKNTFFLKRTDLWHCLLMRLKWDVFVTKGLFKYMYRLKKWNMLLPVSHTTSWNLR